jgi:hypothetical protein
VERNAVGRTESHRLYQQAGGASGRGAKRIRRQQEPGAGNGHSNPEEEEDEETKSKETRGACKRAALLELGNAVSM